MVLPIPLRSAPLAWVVIVLGTVFDPSARAQESLERFARRMEQIQRDLTLRIDQSTSPADRMLFDYGGFAQFSYLSVDDSRNENHGLRQYDLVGYLRLNLDDVAELYVRGRAGYRDFNDGDSFDGLGDELIDPDLDLAYIRFDSGKYRSRSRGQKGEQSVIFQAGRNFTWWANGLVLAGPLDGVVARWIAPGVEIEAIAGRTPLRTVDFDSSRPAFDHNTRRNVFGAILTGQWGTHRPFVYGLYQRDDNKYDARRIDGIDTNFEYTSWYIGAGAAGSLTDRLLYGVEFVFEGGHTLSRSFNVGSSGVPERVDQRTDNIQAWAADVRFDYVFPDSHRTRLSAEMIAASGDSDRLLTSSTVGGNSPGTVDKAFNAFGLVNTGLALAPSVSNLLAARVGASTFPFPSRGVLDRLQVGADYFAYWRTDDRAPIDEPTGAGRYLGCEADLYINWQIAHDLTFALRYGVFFPGAAFGDEGQVRQFLFAGVTYAF